VYFVKEKKLTRLLPKVMVRKGSKKALLWLLDGEGK
jgi:hypothetical protein